MFNPDAVKTVTGRTFFIIFYENPLLKPHPKILTDATIKTDFTIIKIILAYGSPTGNP
jgi:hypothetical protein